MRTAVASENFWHAERMRQIQSRHNPWSEVAKEKKKQSEEQAARRAAQARAKQAKALEAHAKKFQQRIARVKPTGFSYHSEQVKRGALRRMEKHHIKNREVLQRIQNQQSDTSVGDLAHHFPSLRGEVAPHDNQRSARFDYLHNDLGNLSSYHYDGNDDGGEEDDKPDFVDDAGEIAGYDPEMNEVYARLLSPQQDADNTLPGLGLPPSKFHEEQLRDLLLEESRRAWLAQEALRIDSRNLAARQPSGIPYSSRQYPRR